MERGRRAPVLQLKAEESRRLIEWTRRYDVRQALGLRARIILACATGKPNSEIAAETGTSKQTVGKWRQRFIKKRLDGLLDEPRSGAPRQVADEVMKAIIRTLDEGAAAAPSRSTRSLAAELNVSQTTVSRILRTLTPQPGRRRRKPNAQRTYDSDIQSDSTQGSLGKSNQLSTRATILAAAQQAFAETGYSQASMRDIAAMAGVSSTLLLHYFGSKAALFQTALNELIPVDDVTANVNRERFGEHLAHQLFDSDLDLKSPSMIVLAVGNAEARGIMTRVTAERIFAPLAQWLGPPNAEIRAVQILMLCMGLVFYTRQLPVLPAALKRDDILRAWFAESIQVIVDESRPARSNGRRASR